MIRITVIILVTGIVIEMAAAEERFEMEMAKSQRSTIWNDRMKLPIIPSSYD